jgi:hypothetical protein
MGGIHSGTAFHSFLTPSPGFPTGSEAVFNESFAVVLDKVAELTDDAPGTVRPSAGFGLAQYTALRQPTINDAGHVAFTATTNAGVSFDAIGAAGVWTTSDDGTLRASGLAGQAAPGTATTFSQLFRDAAVINNDGDISYIATLTGLIEGGLREGVWVERNGSIEKVMFESETAPGTASKFNDITADAPIDGAGNALVRAQLEDGRDGLWRETSPGTLALVAIQGQTAPGTALNFLNILDFAFNAAGQVAFKSQLSDFGSDGIFATDPSGTLKKIAVDGDVLDIGGHMAELDFIDFDGGLVNTTTGFNDEGQVAFVAGGVFLDVLDEFGNPTPFYGVFVSDAAVTSGDLPGDYNFDGNVDASDYVLWRKNDTTLPGYENWRSHYGQTLSGSGAIRSADAAIPEPTSLLLILSAAIFGSRRRPCTRLLLNRGILIATHCRC